MVSLRIQPKQKQRKYNVEKKDNPRYYTTFFSSFFLNEQARDYAYFIDIAESTVRLAGGKERKLLSRQKSC